jgi:hypothetical protein
MNSGEELWRWPWPWSEEVGRPWAWPEEVGGFRPPLVLARGGRRVPAAACPGAGRGRRSRSPVELLCRPPVELLSRPWRPWLATRTARQAHGGRAWRRGQSASRGLRPRPVEGGAHPRETMAAAGGYGGGARPWLEAGGHGRQREEAALVVAMRSQIGGPRSFQKPGQTYLKRHFF